MKNIKKTVVATILLVFLLGTATAQDLQQTKTPEAVGLSSERLNRLDTVLKADIEEGKINGAVILLARKGKIAYFKNIGWRDPERKWPIEKDSIFRVYSMTKSITAVATAMLMEEGKILLSDPVAKYIPSFKEIQVGEIRKDETGKETLALVAPRNVMTIYDLLLHTSGLSYFFFPPRAIQERYMMAGMHRLEELTNAEVCERLAKLPLVAHPGTRYQYGMSYDVLGRVLEVISGLPLDRFFEERIYKPLKMKDSGFRVKESDANRLVYLDPKVPFYIDPTSPLRRYMSGGAGTVSTAMDFARFAQMLLNGGEIDGVRLISPRTLSFMTSDHLGPLGNRDDALYVPGRGYGQGFDFYIRLYPGRATFLGNPGEFYKGGIAGTLFWVDPKEELVAVFMVSAPDYREYYRFLIKNLIYQAILR